MWLIKCCYLCRWAVHPWSKSFTWGGTVTAGRVVSCDGGKFLHPDCERGHLVSPYERGPVHLWSDCCSSRWSRTWHTLLCHRVCQKLQQPKPIFSTCLCHHWGVRVTSRPPAWTVQECRYKSTRCYVNCSVIVPFYYFLSSWLLSKRRHEKQLSRISSYDKSENLNI